MDSSKNNDESRRKRVPRVQYTPTQRSSTIISNYYLLFFDVTESYQIVARSSIKKFDDQDSATLVIRNKSCKGKIIFSGSLDDCERELGRRTRLSQQDNNNNEMDLDEVDDETDETVMAASQRQITTEPRYGTTSAATFDLPSSSENDEVEIEKSDLDDDFLDQHLNTKKKDTNKRKRSSNNNNNNNEKKKRKRTNNKADNHPQVNQIDSESQITFSGISILSALENKFSALESKLLDIDNRNDQQMTRLTKKIDYLSASSIVNKSLLDPYRDESNESFRKELMYDKINLLGTVALSVGDFARRTMRIVFSEDDLKTKVLPPKRSHLARTSLDEEKFELVNEAVRTKFKLDSVKYAAFYKNILRKKLSDFLIEERRRESMQMARHFLRTGTAYNSS